MLPLLYSGEYVGGFPTVRSCRIINLIYAKFRIVDSVNDAFCFNDHTRMISVDIWWASLALLSRDRKRFVEYPIASVYLR